MHIPPIGSVESADPEIAASSTTRTAADKVRLIPSENYVSARCSRRRARCSPTSTPRATRHKRYYEGQQYVDPIEELANDRAKALFGAEHVNVQPYSGSPGEPRRLPRLRQAGRHHHGPGPARRRPPHPRLERQHHRQGSGSRSPTACAATTEPRSTSTRCASSPARSGPSSSGAAAPRTRATIDFAGLRRHRRRGGRDPRRRHRAHRRARRRRRAPVAGRHRRRGHHHHAQDPARPARRHDPVQGGARDGHRQGGVPRPPGRPAQPHHRRRSRWRCTRPPSPRSRTTPSQVVANAKALAEALAARGFRPGHRRHRQPPHPGRPDAQGDRRQAGAPRRSTAPGIVANYNSVPFDPRKPFDPSGVRLGTPAVTTRGMREAHMVPLACSNSKDPAGRMPGI